MPRLVIDTDPGVDDAFALALAARSPDIDLAAVTTVFGNVGLDRTTANALGLLALAGRPDVPVAAGAARPLVYPAPHEADYAHGQDGLSGGAARLPAHPHGLHRLGAIDLLAQTLRDSPTPVTLAPIGPLTNIALLMATHPDLRSKIDRLVIMGGALTGGNTTAAAEFNIWADPEAAYRVLVEEDVPTVLVPIDLTYRCAVDGAWLTTLRETGPLGEILESFTPSYRAHYTELLGHDCTILHDAVAVAEAINPGLLTTKRMPVTVQTTGPGRGAVIADQRLNVPLSPGYREIDVAVDTDLDGLRNWFLTLLGRTES
ncbi:nucleoside hydrolase [Actinokineospora sp. UTMC 2448]|uniref:nucleoside hydrolase n=1 Tax=Actinokineospora sp. UTMC 2448 TaxID=2268449 RepID=UPI002164770B|nr:nucleoside hydrolase [Actinokineospora sp. UTMC 2448]UVS81290.1 Pyrimidine-specific ribonucleoside hydrolase RihA [Actinokineospora sp. UTMC 2448]